jgi:cytochrome o ubiquinol oxidase subunit 2
MNKLRIFLVLGLCGLLSACDKAGMLHPKGIIAADEKQLFITAILLMLVVAIPVFILSAVLAWKYRASQHKSTYSPNWAHNTLIEVVCWGIPIIIIAVLAVITWVSSHRLDPYKPLDSKTKPITIQVVALEWKWLFIYPEQHIATINFVQFPVNVPVEFLITSEGPMNSFHIPQLGSQIYAMAGMKTKVHLIANEMGDFRGLSANYSGDGFAGMKFTARASSQAQFDQWVKTVKQSPTKLTLQGYDKIAKPSQNDPVQYFAHVEKDLFDTIIMKFMMPMEAPPDIHHTKSATTK